VKPEQAKEWFEQHKSETADDAARALLALVASVRVQTIEQAVDVCEREARACFHHAKAIKEFNPKSRVPLSRAHDMAGRQSSACGHYIRVLLESEAR